MPVLVQIIEKRRALQTNLVLNRWPILFKPLKPSQNIILLNRGKHSSTYAHFSTIKPYPKSQTRSRSNFLPIKSRRKIYLAQPELWFPHIRASPNGDKGYPFPLSPIFRRSDRTFCCYHPFSDDPIGHFCSYILSYLILSDKALCRTPMPDGKTNAQ